VHKHFSLSTTVYRWAVIAGGGLLPRVKGVDEEVVERAMESIRSWRSRASPLATGTPRTKGGPSKLGPSYLANVARPFFQGVDPGDSTYVRAYRAVVYGIAEYSTSLRTVMLRSAGRRLGTMLVRRGDVRSVDDLPRVFVLNRIGLLDIVRESFNRTSINIYECMSCYGVKYVGSTMCDFEAGVIEGAMELLVGRNRTREVYCWGLGYPFCGFEVVFE